MTQSEINTNSLTHSTADYWHAIGQADRAAADKAWQEASVRVLPNGDIIMDECPHCGNEEGNQRTSRVKDRVTECGRCGFNEPARVSITSFR